jgi:hypothetical protein
MDPAENRRQAMTIGDIVNPASRDFKGKRRFAAVIIDKTILIIPVNTGSNTSGHWIIFIVDYRKKPILWFFDSLGGPPPGQLQQLLEKRFPRATFHRIKQRVQYDGCQCGVWCVALVSRLLGFEDITTPDRFSMEPDYYIDTEAKDERESNNTKIVEFRRTLIAEVRRSEANC